jgi:hypothetical protein
MTPPQTIRSFPELLEELRKGNAPHRANEETQTIEMQTGAQELGGILVIRWEKLLPFVQVIQPLIRHFPAERAPDLETAIARINNVAVIAGLGLDHGGALLYYRMTLPILEDGVRADLLKIVLHGIIRNAGELLEPLKAVVAGAPGAEVLSLISGRPKS